MTRGGNEVLSIFLCESIYLKGHRPISLKSYLQTTRYPVLAFDVTKLLSAHFLPCKEK